MSSYRAISEHSSPHTAHTTHAAHAAHAPWGSSRLVLLLVDDHALGSSHVAAH